MALQKISRSLLNTGVADSSDATAITIDSSENVTFAGTITGTLATAAQTNITSVGTLTSFRSTGIDDNADALAITIDSSERVGIGTTSPSAKLSVSSGSVKIVNSGTDAYFLEGVRDGGNTTLRMYDNNNNLYIDSYTNMSFRANQTGGGSGGNFFFGGGNVGIGLPSGSPDARLTVSGSANSEQVIITGNGNQNRGLSISTAATGGQQDATVIFNAQDTENVAYPAMKFQSGGGDILRFHHQSIINNARVGLAFPCELMFNGEYTAGQQDVALEAGHAARIEFLKDDFFRIQGSASVSAGATVSYADKLKVNIDSGGILFGSDTAAANTLDDYEEGTFTPSFSGATLSTATGFYTKIGNQVTVHFRVITSGGLPSSGGQVQVGNLPFTIGTNFGGVGGLYVGPSNVSSATGGGGTIVPYLTGGETFIRFLNVDTGTYGYTLWGELEVSANNVVTAIGTVTYQV